MKLYQSITPVSTKEQYKEFESTETVLSDAQVGSAIIKDPFIDWENRMENV